MAKLLLLLSLMFLLPGIVCSPLQTPESPAARDASFPAQREKRSYTPTPNYPLTVYSNLADDYGGKGEWKKLNCNVIYNCEKISPQHCTQLGSKFFCSNNQGGCVGKTVHAYAHGFMSATPLIVLSFASFTVSNICVVDFTLEKAAYSGADLALYKARQPGVHMDYLILIIYMTSDSSGYIVAYKQLSSVCSGWQVFHLDDYVTRSLADEETTEVSVLKFRIIVSTISYEQLSCQEVSNLFILKAKFDEEEFAASGDSSPFIGSSEGRKPLAPESTEPALPPLQERIDYLPTLNLFHVNTSRTRRDTGSNIEGSKAVENTRRCYRAENISILQDAIKDHLYTVVKPEQYDVGECRWEHEDKAAADKERTDGHDQDRRLHSKQVCAPTKYRGVLAYIKAKGSYLVVSLPDVVIEECGWVEKSHDITS